MGRLAAHAAPIDRIWVNLKPHIPFGFVARSPYRFTLRSLEENAQAAAPSRHDPAEKHLFKGGARQAAAWRVLKRQQAPP